jgi:hypothetical protein
VIWFLFLNETHNAILAHRSMSEQDHLDSLPGCSGSSDFSAVESWINAMRCKSSCILRTDSVWDRRASAGRSLDKVSTDNDPQEEPNEDTSTRISGFGGKPFHWCG